MVVTGPTGSGKSTTCAALIDIINLRRSCHILTIEDPIEYLHRDRRAVVCQREIGLDAPTYHVALRAALRQDPDVILVGEVRDEETAMTALRAAETGHLVLCTMHTTTRPRPSSASSTCSASAQAGARSPDARLDAGRHLLPAAAARRAPAAGC